MNGHIIPGTNIAVDYWKIKGKQQNCIHFLTHLHGDHISGLTSSWKKPVYCSEMSAYILRAHHGISPALLHVCPLNESISVIVSPFQTFTVTAYDANHCPGAVMFYFQGDFGTILYTGDFRTSPKGIKNLMHLTNKVDLLYLDNTFCSPKCTFPTREECFTKIVEIAKEHKDHNILIGVRNVGKEALLARIGETLDECVSVSPKSLEIARILYDTDVLTTSALLSCRLQAVPMHQVTTSNIENRNRISPTIGIIPSAIFTGLDCQPYSNAPNMYVVPYSDHSSYEELVEFVSAIRPGKILPIVNNTRGPFGCSFKDRLDMSCFRDLLSSNRDGRYGMQYNADSMLLTEHFSEIEDEFPRARNDERLGMKYGTGRYETGTFVKPVQGSEQPGSRKRKWRYKDFIRPKKKATGVTYDSSCVESEGAVTSTETIKSNGTSGVSVGSSGTSDVSVCSSGHINGLHSQDKEAIDKSVPDVCGSNSGNCMNQNAVIHLDLDDDSESSNLFLHSVTAEAVTNDNSEVTRHKVSALRDNSSECKNSLPSFNDPCRGNFNSQQTCAVEDCNILDNKVKNSLQPSAVQISGKMITPQKKLQTVKDFSRVDRSTGSLLFPIGDLRSRILGPQNEPHGRIFGQQKNNCCTAKDKLDSRYNNVNFSDNNLRGQPFDPLKSCTVRDFSRSDGRMVLLDESFRSYTLKLKSGLVSESESLPRHTG